MAIFSRAVPYTSGPVNRTLVTAVLAVALSASLAAQQSPSPRVLPPVTPAVAHAPSAMTAASQGELVKTYCTGCHNDRSKAGELTLAGWDAARASTQRELTEKMIHKLRAGMMPPSGAHRPAPAQITQFVTALESRMDTLAAADPNPGW